MIPTIELLPDQRAVAVLDQRRLPFAVERVLLRTAEDAARAIAEMTVRGAPLIGLTGAAGVWLSYLNGGGSETVARDAAMIRSARPTAVNLAWGVDRVLGLMARSGGDVLFDEVERMIAEDAEMCRMIGVHGLPLLRAIAGRKGGERVNVMTHCNAGRLACAAWGTATSPIYQAHAEGVPLHVWVSETRPRNQGARLTAWELAESGVPHTIIADNAAGHLMQRGEVDIVIVGCDRMATNGDAANKIGTYLKALAARDTGVPFYVALPSSTIDPGLRSGEGIVIESRGDEEVLAIEGACDGGTREVRLTPEGSSACNPGFDVTPARLIDGVITERGLCAPGALLDLYPELRVEEHRG